MGGVLWFLILWCLPCSLLFNMVLVWAVLKHTAKRGRTDAWLRHSLACLGDAALRVGTVGVAIIIGTTAVPPLLVVALVPGVAYRFGAGWMSVGVVLTPLLGLVAGLAAMEWRRSILRCRCLAVHPAVVVPESEPQPAPAAPVQPTCAELD